MLKAQQEILFYPLSLKQSDIWSTCAAFTKERVLHGEMDHATEEIVLLRERGRKTKTSMLAPVFERNILN